MKTAKVCVSVLINTDVSADEWSGWGEVPDVLVLWEHSAAWMAVDFLAASIPMLALFQYITWCLVFIVPEQLALAGHFPFVLEAAGSRVAVVRAPRARVRMMDLMEGILSILLFICLCLYEYRV